jgi:site-specific DNA-methyltransferase (adenine-specific)
MRFNSMASATISSGSKIMSLPQAVRDWPTDRLADEVVRAIQTCRKQGQAAAQSAWQAGAYLSLLHVRLIRGRKWADWLRQQKDLITEDTARRYILLYERTGGQAAKLHGLTLTEAYASFGITRYIEADTATPGTNGTGPTHGPPRIEADHRCQPAPTPPALNGTHRANGHPTASSSAVTNGAVDPLYGIDEETILSAAAKIRQRRVAEQLRRAQERRRQAAPTPIRRRRGSPVLHGDCLDLLPTLEDDSVSLVVTSPPYAEQRKSHYEGIAEDSYSEFTVGWMAALWPKLTPDGSVLIVIRPHIQDGIISDYVLRTRLALRDFGWRECEELIWVKPNAPPLGSKLRPRRAWESILWFSKSTQPFCDLKACGGESARLGFGGSPRFAENGFSERSAWHPCVESFGYGNGTARVTDVFVAPVGGNEPGVDHPAVFPLVLAEQLIKTFSQEGALVLDPFCGSGQTLMAAKGCGRRYLGIEREERYVRVALERLGR